MSAGRIFGFTQAARAIASLRSEIDGRKIAIQEAERLRAIIIQEFVAQQPVSSEFGDWPDLKPLTLAERKMSGHGGSNKLVRSASLFNSVTVIPTSNGAWVGVPRKAGKAPLRRGVKPRKKKGRGSKRARKPAGGEVMGTSQVVATILGQVSRKRASARSGSSADTVKKKPGEGKKPKAGKARASVLANVALLMEFGSKKGVAVKITPAMRRFLFGVLFKQAHSTGKVSGKKKGFVVYSIPPRPFLRPAAAEWERTLDAEIKKKMQAMLSKV